MRGETGNKQKQQGMNDGEEQQQQQQQNQLIRCVIYLLPFKVYDSRFVAGIGIGSMSLSSPRLSSRPPLRSASPSSHSILYNYFSLGRFSATFFFWGDLCENCAKIILCFDHLLLLSTSSARPLFALKILQSEMAGRTAHSL